MAITLKFRPCPKYMDVPLKSIAINQVCFSLYFKLIITFYFFKAPINIFNSEQVNYAPLRLSYQRGSHYNAIIDPYNATVGVGLGIAGYKPELQTKEAVRLSEQLEIEQTMFEDKLKTTDWEATNEAIEEQIARESYLQWCRENLRKSRAVATATSTSATQAAADDEASPSKKSQQQQQQRCSTITSTSTTATCSSNDVNSSNAQPAVAASISDCTNVMLDQSYGLTNKLFKLDNPSGNAENSTTNDFGFESDDTDMSSTSSKSGGNVSPSTSAARLNKKSKNRSAGTAGLKSSSSKKRRRDCKTNRYVYIYIFL